MPSHASSLSGRKLMSLRCRSGFRCMTTVPPDVVKGMGQTQTGMYDTTSQPET